MTRFFKPAAHPGLVLGALLGVLIGALPAWADAPRKVIIDDDLGGFRLAPALLIQAPDVQVLGITTVSGTEWRDSNTAHALRLVEILGRPDIPVVPGATYAVVNSEEATKRWESQYGRLVYKGAWMDQKWIDGAWRANPRYHAADVVPPIAEGTPKLHASAEVAAEFLVRQVRQFPGQITLIATGPLTNLALAQRLDPSFAANVKELIYMGGSLSPQQRLNTPMAAIFAREYVNTPRLEFNFRWDPEAASAVLRAPWKKMVMVPVDPTTATELSTDLLAQIPRHNSPLTSAMKQFVPTGLPLWDEL